MGIGEAEAPFRMKILVICALYLISGGVRCFDVIGYPGGSVMIHCYYSQHGPSSKYFCEEASKRCVHIPPAVLQKTWRRNSRVSVYNIAGVLTVIFRRLTVEDSGSYQCGGTGVWNSSVNLKVNSDPCCSGPKTVAGYLGETLTINCSYPEEFKPNYKTFFRQNGQYFTSVIRTTETQRDRFSISDNQGSKVLSVRISDVREDDGGVYYCAVRNNEGELVSYNSFYTEIQLQVTAPFRATPTTPTAAASCRTSSAAPTATTSDGPFSSSAIIIIIIIIISVSVCVVLLLIGGSALIFYRLRCTKKQGSTVFNQQSKSASTADGDYENDPPGKQCSIRMGPVYQNMGPNTIQSNSVYQSLDSKTREPNSVYHTLNPNNNQSGTIYQSLDPTPTNQIQSTRV